MVCRDFELPKARWVTAVPFFYLPKAGKTMVFPLKSKPPWLPTSAANRIKLNTWQVTVWFPEETRHIQAFGLSSRKIAGKVYKSFRNQALLPSFFTKPLVYCKWVCKSTLKTGLQPILGTTPTRNQITQSNAVMCSKKTSIIRKIIELSFCEPQVKNRYL